MYFDLCVSFVLLTYEKMLALLSFIVFNCHCLSSEAENCARHTSFTVCYRLSENRGPPSLRSISPPEIGVIQFTFSVT